MANDLAIANLINDSTSQARAAVQNAAGVSVASAETLLAHRFLPVAGSPPGATFNGGPAWGLSHGSTQGVAAYVDPVPASWNTANINLLFAVTAGTSGGVRFQLTYGYWTPASGGSSATALATDTLTTPSTAGVQTFTIVANAGIAGSPLTWWRDPTRQGTAVVTRLGTDAADTYAGVVNFLGLQIVKAS